MGNLGPLLSRELRSYLQTPVAHLVAVAFLLVSGLLFTMILIDYSRYSFELIRSGYAMQVEGLTVAEGILRPTLSTTAFLLLLIAPLLTMRSFAEEKKSGTIELLFTLPLRDGELVLAKWLAPLLVQALLLGAVFGYSLLLAFFKPMPAGEALCGFAGLALLAAFFSAIGVFISALTENQIVAAAWTFGANMLFWLVGWLGGDGVSAAAQALKGASAYEHFNNFMTGVVDSADVFYFASLSYLFIFLTLRVLESKRWRS